MGAAAESVGRSVGARARLFLDGVGPGVVTDVTSRDLHGMTVERRLPFLRLDTEVLDEEGRRGRIRDVRVDVHDGTPALVLDLEYEEEEVDVFGADDTLPAFPLPFELREEPELRVEVVSGTPMRRDSTVPWFGGALVEPSRVTVEPTLAARDSVVTFKTFGGVAQGPTALVSMAIVPAPETGRPAPPPPRSFGALVRAATTRLATWLRAAVDHLRGGPPRTRYAI